MNSIDLMESKEPLYLSEENNNYCVCLIQWKFTPFLIKCFIKISKSLIATLLQEIAEGKLINLQKVFFLFVNKSLSPPHLFQYSDSLHSGHWLHCIQWWVFSLPSPYFCCHFCDVWLRHFLWMNKSVRVFPPSGLKMKEIKEKAFWCNDLTWCFYSELTEEWISIRTLWHTFFW